MPTQLDADNRPHIFYNAFIRDYGWHGELQDGLGAGTVGLSAPLDRIQIRARKIPGFRFRIYTRNREWSRWASSNEILGDDGDQIEAISLRSEDPGFAVNPAPWPIFAARWHIEGIGWENYSVKYPTPKGGGIMIGRPDSGLRLEAFQIMVGPAPSVANALLKHPPRPLTVEIKDDLEKRLDWVIQSARCTVSVGMAVGTCQSTVGILCAPAVMAAVIECVDLYNKTNKVITIGRRASKNDPALHHDFDFRGDRVHEYILDCRGADPERFSNIA